MRKTKRQLIVLIARIVLIFLTTIFSLANHGFNHTKNGGMVYNIFSYEMPKKTKEICSTWQEKDSKSR